MMNELQRQMYLLALGLESYMPRRHLSFAPQSVACKLPEVSYVKEEENNTVSLISVGENTQLISSQMKTVESSVNIIPPIHELINNIFQPKIARLEPRVIDSQPVYELPNKVSLIDSFSLTIWRPFDNLMIIDSRNTQLALPTELLLKNVLHRIFSTEVRSLKEEVLHWPMIENSFAKRTVYDARTELQTWLSVQCEIFPVKHLWFMGANAADYFLPEVAERADHLWQSTRLCNTSAQALILPSLNELLQQPLMKKKLFCAIKFYYSQHNE